MLLCLLVSHDICSSSCLYSMSCSTGLSPSKDKVFLSALLLSLPGRCNSVVRGTPCWSIPFHGIPFSLTSSWQKDPLSWKTYHTPFKGVSLNSEEICTQTGSKRKAWDCCTFLPFISLVSLYWKAEEASYFMLILGC